MAAKVLPLTPLNALVTTAWVEIRTLTLGKKQVTLSVFRQIPYEDVLANDGTLRGVPWGWVNYEWKDDGRWGDQPLHVVWQSGAGLRRAVVPLPEAVRNHNPYRPGPTMLAILAGLYGRVQGLLAHQAALHVIAAPETVELHTWSAAHSWRRAYRLRREGTPWGRVVDGVDDEATIAALLEWRRPVDTDDDHPYRRLEAVRKRLGLAHKDPLPPSELAAERERELGALRDELRRTHFAPNVGPDERAVVAAIDATVAEARAILAAWASSRQACEAAGQLFIAV